MTRAEAKKYVCRCTAMTLEADLDNGSGWIFAADGVDDGDRSPSDLKRILEAANELSAELRRRSQP
jgi:hypothetical protein